MANIMATWPLEGSNTSEQPLLFVSTSAIAYFLVSVCLMLRNERKDRHF